VRLAVMVCMRYVSVFVCLFVLVLVMGGVTIGVFVLV